MSPNNIPFPGFLYCCLVAQLCPTLHNPVDCKLAKLLCPWDFPRQEYWNGLPFPSPGELEWVAISFSRGASWPRDWTQVSCIAGRHLTVWATKRELLIKVVYPPMGLLLIILASVLASLREVRLLPSLLGIGRSDYISKEWLPSPWKRLFWVAEDLHLKGTQERIYNCKFF